MFKYSAKKLIWNTSIQRDFLHSSISPCSSSSNKFYKMQGKLLNTLGLYTKRGFKTRRTGTINNVLAEGSETYMPNFSHLHKPFWFTLSAVGCSFCGAIIWQYESLRQKFFINRSLATSKQTQAPKMTVLRQNINKWWDSFSPGKKMVIGIMAANLGVFLLWRIPQCVPVLSRYFLSTPLSEAPCSSMILSIFSHRDIFHIATNMYVFWSFSNVAINLFGREQLLAVYLSAGVVSSLTSHVAKVLRVSAIPSLGASGALMAIIGAVCVTYPEAKLSIVLIGQLFNFSFSADHALKAIFVFDAVGLLMGWKIFDHAAHLGGLLFGVWYVKYGRRLIWNKRESVMKKWHHIRGKPV